MVSEKDLLWMTQYPEYESYLALRRQLGEQSNGDMTMAQWCKTWPFQQKIHIKGMIDKVCALQANRDLSWEAYQYRSDIGDRSFTNKAAWDNAPLFIQAAIIPEGFLQPALPGKAPQAPGRRFDGSHLESRDRPKGIVDNW